jgi:hypothetical protein
MPDWLTIEIKYVLPKSEDTKDARNYRPIKYEQDVDSNCCQKNPIICGRT